MSHPQRREGDQCPKGCACVLQEKRQFDLGDRSPRVVFCALCGARYLGQGERKKVDDGLFDLESSAIVPW